MALTPQPLFRAQDVGTSTVLGPTVPRNWRVKSNKIGDLTDANPNAAKPRYTPAGAADWAGGAYGDDVAQAQATVALADKNGGPAQANYGPRNQGDRATLLGMPIVIDVGRRRGNIGPRDPYPTKASAAPAVPTLTSLSPNTAAAGAATPQFVMKLIGTNFTPWSTILLGGIPAPSSIYSYISPTEMRCQMSPGSSVAGTTSVTVVDHSVATTPSLNFTWT